MMRNCHFSESNFGGGAYRVESCDDGVMGPLDLFTFVVLAVLLGVGILAAFRLGALPGQIAARRGHPQADAIRVAGWVGLVTLGLLWPVALIWAYTSTGATPEFEQELDRIRERVKTLEHRERKVAER